MIDDKKYALALTNEDDVMVLLMQVAFEQRWMRDFVHRNRKLSNESNKKYPMLKAEGEDTLHTFFQASGRGPDADDDHGPIIKEKRKNTVYYIFYMYIYIYIYTNLYKYYHIISRNWKN